MPSPPPPPPVDAACATPALADTPLRMSYRIGRGEQGVLTFEPYKSALLPLWRFRTPAIARDSAAALRARFKAYEAAGDFVGMDMARKFVQMGVTRARRYANYRGGRKYDKRTGAQLEKGRAHDGRADKLEASELFRELLEWVKARPRYAEARRAFLEEQRGWDGERHEEAKAESENPRTRR